MRVWAGIPPRLPAVAGRIFDLLWAVLSVPPKSDANAIRLKIGRALQLAAPGNTASTARVIALLKTVTPGEISNTCIAEARILGPGNILEHIYLLRSIMSG